MSQYPNLITANPNVSVVGAFIQPSAGLAMTAVANFRDSSITVQAGTSATTPSAGATIASITPGVAGLWEVTANIGISGTTAVLVDSNNFALNAGGSAVLGRICYPVLGTAGAVPETIQPVVLNLTASSVVTVTAIANATSGATYTANIVARQVG
jgi:hypothetical protein